MSRLFEPAGEVRAPAPTRSRTILTSSSKSTSATAQAPLVTIVGRPNVGKSTLFNRLVGSRRAIVGDEPGITRDRLYGKANWRGQDLRVVDTGGILPDDTDFIPSEIFRQARFALDEAAVIVMVVDARTELAGPDLELARLLQRTGKPIFLAANKIDSEKQSSLTYDLHRLGFRNMFPISAEHGRGIEELLDAIIATLPAKSLTTEATETTEEYQDKKPRSSRSTRRLEDTANKERQKKDNQRKANDEGPTTNDGFDTDEPTTDEPTTDDHRPTTETRVAIIGHPNVGKSTLLNRLTGAERAIVSSIPGTTRDAVDELVTRDGQNFRFIDTAGIRRKGKTHLMAEKLSVVMARKHLEEADIALLVIDATEGVSALDAAIAGYAHESGRSVIIIVNKWDLFGAGAFVRQKSGQSRDASETEDTSERKANKRRPHKQLPSDREAYEDRLREELKFLSYAPVLFVSASSGKGTDKIFSTLAQVAAERRKRVTTGQMNRFLKHVDFDRASVPMKQRVRILYLTQAGTSPPTFVLFTDRQVKLHFSYQRFLENQIRKEFGFVGTPIWIKVKARS
jgi:GTP-binding protein